VLERCPIPSGPATDGGAATRVAADQAVHAEANQQTVKDLVANLKDLKVESQVNLKLDDEVRKDKQLDAAHARSRRRLEGRRQEGRRDCSARAAPAGQLVVVADKPDVVWAAKGYSSYLYTKEPKDFRDKEILKFDDGNAAQVTIVNSHGTLSFTKGDKWTGHVRQEAHRAASTRTRSRTCCAPTRR
jgi:hypothetical protein